MATRKLPIPKRKNKILARKFLFPQQENQNPTRKWQFPMRKSKILAWKSLFLRRKSKIRARQSSGSLRSEASQGSSTASRRATRVLDKLPRGFVFNYGELALPVSKCRASSLYSVPELSLGDGNGRRPGGIGCSKRLHVV